MENNWHKRSKRWKESQLNGLQALYSENPNVVPTEANVRPKAKKKRSTVERDMQIALVTWIKEEKGQPVLMIPNEGKRSFWMAKLFVMMGLWPGACDLLLPVMRKQYGGFFIELKEPGKKPRPEQWDFIYEMRDQGYKADYYDNLDEARKAIEMYLDA